jgi:hypothetical protein
VGVFDCDDGGFDNTIEIITPILEGMWKFQFVKRPGFFKDCQDV